MRHPDLYEEFEKITNTAISQLGSPDSYYDYGLPPDYKTASIRITVLGVEYTITAARFGSYWNVWGVFPCTKLGRHSIDDWSVKWSIYSIRRRADSVQGYVTYLYPVIRSAEIERRIGLREAISIVKEIISLAQGTHYQPQPEIVEISYEENEYPFICLKPIKTCD